MRSGLQLVSDGGVRQMLARLKQAPKKALSAGRDVGEDIVSRARVLCPRQTGRLARSIRAVAKQTSRGVEVTLEAGAGLDYAVQVHEDLTLRHPHGQAKFLEIPVVEKAREFPERVENVVDAEVARG